MAVIVDLFGGPGGWAEGLRGLGLDEVGIELDPWACATRRAAGHRVIRADVSTLPVDHLAGRVEGLIASPPCRAFSLAGNGAGRDLLEVYVGDIDRGDWGCRTPPHGSFGAEVLEVGRWAETIHPTWIACEQVPPVLPIWQAYAQRWRALYGWSTWCGILNSADYGVPQTRQRAILLARTDGRPALPPEPTHTRSDQASLFATLRPWVSMAEALGWTGEDQPARTLCGDRSPRWLYPDQDGTHGRVVLRAGAQENATVRTTDEPAPTVLGSWDNGDTRWELNRRQQKDGVDIPPVSSDRPAPTLTVQAGCGWVWERPATTIAGDPRVFPPGGHIANDGRDNSRMVGRSATDIKLTIAEALTLQSFPADYPVQGNKTAQFRQVGDAVPSRLAAHVVAALTGAAMETAA